VAAQQLAELGGAMEGIGDQLAGGERERRIDSPVALGDQMRSRRERPGVEPGEPLDRAHVGWGRQAHGNRALPGAQPMGIKLPMSVSVPQRHDHQYGPVSDLCKMLLSRNRS